MTPKLSIIIVNYRSAAVLEHCLRSLHVSLTASCELLVVDNDGESSVRQIVKDSGFHGHYFPQEKNIGYSAGVQLGAQHARGEFLCLLHPDVLTEASSLDRLLDWVEQHPRSVVGPRHMDARGSILTTARPPITKRDILGPAEHQGYPWPKSWARMMSWWSPAVRLTTAVQRAESPIRVPVLSSSCLVMPREVWEEVGPFTLALNYVGIESEWFSRAAELGMTAWYIPTATVIHEQSHSIRQAEPAHIRMMTNHDRRWHAARFGLVAVFFLGIVLWLEHRFKPRDIA